MNVHLSLRSSAGRETTERGGEGSRLAMVSVGMARSSRRRRIIVDIVYVDTPVVGCFEVGSLLRCFSFVAVRGELSTVLVMWRVAAGFGGDLARAAYVRWSGLRIRTVLVGSGMSKLVVCVQGDGVIV